MGGFYCVFIDILTGVQVCDMAAYNGPSRKHYFNHRKAPLVLTTMECRNL
jgi:hypothetical protein